MFRVFSVIVLFSCGVYTYIECKVCQSMDIRNSVTNLGKLRNCTEIAGYLRIVLMEKSEESDFANYVFPELTHITGYLLLFDVVKLTSIAQLFPNLRVIRGRELFLSAVLVVHHMPDLKEIGTEKLMFIGKGLVIFDKVPSLCFIDTIDWKRIGASGTLIYDQNKECEPCPRECGEYCWNSYKCQEIDTDKCHVECLGCKKYNSSLDCLACKNFDDHGECVAKCPKTKIVHSSYSKCITEEQCRNNLNGTVHGHWFVFNNVCVNDCPIKYRKEVSDKNETTCVFCGDKCTKSCIVKDPLETMNDIEKLQGCTHIEGSIVLRYGGTAFSELEFYMSSIKYIRDSLVVARSQFLRTLEFLINLTEIEGRNLDNRYAILVYENQNLQRLWNISNPNFKLKIRNGTIGFHNNPLLCLSEIAQLANAVNIKYDETDVSRNSNGDKTSCSIIDLHVQITKLTSHNATLSWQAPQCDKICIGYTVFYKVAYSKDGSKFSSKDVCLENQWNSIFTSNNTLVLKELQPYKTYTFYIKFYQSSGLAASETNLTYFTTLPDSPDPPPNLVAGGISSDTILLQWTESISNGVLSHYRVKYYEETENTIQDLRNYCNNPRTMGGNQIDRDSSIFFNSRENLEEANVNKFCNCKKTQESFPDVSFLNFDASYPSCDRDAMSKYGIDPCESVEYTVLDDTSDTFNVAKRDRNTAKKHLHKEMVTKIIPKTDKTSYNITKLKHFTTYIFYFSACNYFNETENTYICSRDEYRVGRTHAKVDADNITNVKISQTKSYVRIDWTEPKEPNSKIVAYTITYTKVAAFAKPVTICIPRSSNFSGSYWLINDLGPGKYSIKVSAESLAGPGLPSMTMFFEIPYPPEDDMPTIVFTSVLILFCILTATSLFLFWYKKKLQLDNLHLIASINPDYDTTIYVADDWEMDRNNIEIENGLGHGTFGIVYQGKIKSTNLQCAIKTINENRNLHERMEFLNEASVMKTFSNCHHVVKLLGVVSRGEPPLVIMELMEMGDLKKYLHHMRNDDSSSLTTKDIYRMAIEIADGMAYLSAKKFVHRDLAARNCMVAGDRTVKIGDFGMARDIYETDYYKKESKGLLPVRWMAPESLGDGVFTSNSDVWSYGIVLWEISTLAEQPYQGLSNEEVLRFVVSKGHLQRPNECSDILFEIMRICWSWRPNDRPTFWDIVERLEGLVGQEFRCVSFVHSNEGIDQREIYDKQRVYSPPALCTDQERAFLLNFSQQDNENNIPSDSIRPINNT